MGRRRARVTANQIIAANLLRARKLRGWTQDQAAEKLAPFLGVTWSRATFSAAERTAAGKRLRQFDADEIAAFALAFDLPIAWWFLPEEPEEGGTFPTLGVTNKTTLELLKAAFATIKMDDRVNALIRHLPGGFRHLPGGTRLSAVEEESALSWRLDQLRAAKADVQTMFDELQSTIAPPRRRGRRGTRSEEGEDHGDTEAR